MPRATPGVRVSELLINAQQTAWSDDDFVVLAPPVPLRSAHPGVRVVTLLRVPHDARITVVDEGGSPRLVPPAGTRAERIAYEAGDIAGTWTVSGVRGAEIAEGDQQQMRALQPLYATAFSPLVGYSWRRGDAPARDEARRLLDLALRTALPAMRARPHSDTAASALVTLNDCTRCHEGNAVGAQGRRTDTAGWFSTLATLESTFPLELVQRASDFPACRATSTRQSPCVDRSASVLRVDMRRALARRDPRAVRTCQARRYLHDRMDAAARAAFADSFAECNISPAAAPVQVAPDPPSTEPPPPSTPPRSRRRPSR